MKTKNVFQLFLIAAPFLLALFVYWPGLNGPFLLDDYANLEPLGYGQGVTDTDTASRFVFGNSSGPTGRPVSMASFLLDDSAWPSNPRDFKKTNLFLHLIAGLLIFLVVSRVVETELGFSKDQGFYFSLVVTSFWVVHPLNVSTTLYVVQRMTVLSAIFVLSGMYLYLLGRQRWLEGNKSSVLFILFFLCVLLGVLSKENAVLLLVFLFSLEFFWFLTPTFKCFEYLRRNKKNVVIFMAACSLLLCYLSYPVWGSAYSFRDFDLFHRLYFQVSVIGDYIFKITSPLLSELNFFNGAYESSDRIDFDAHFFIRAIIFLSLVALFVHSVVTGRRLQSFGLLWFFSFHLLESTVLPLELYFEHRNYVPGIGLLIYIVNTFRCLADRCGAQELFSVVVATSVVIFLAFSTLLLSITWSHAGMLFLKWEMDEPNSVRAKLSYSDYLEKKGFPENSIEHIERAIALEPDSIGLRIKKVLLVCKSGIDADLSSTFSALEKAERFDYGAPSYLSELINYNKVRPVKECGSPAFGAEISEVLTVIDMKNKDGWRGKSLAKYYSAKTDYYTSIGSFVHAVESIENAISYQPTVDLNLKAAVIFASGGLYEDALKKLEAAREADVDRGAFYPSRLDEINYFAESVAKAHKKRDEYRDL